MSKLQPNFSWQKYEGQPEDQKEQFQFQLQQQHILAANAVNSTIDDESFWTRERQTSFTWIDGTPIYTKTITGTIVGTTTNTFAHGITNINKVVRIEGTAQNALPLSGFSLPLPYLDAATLNNSLMLSMDTTNAYITALNGTWNGYLFSVTIYYTKT